MKTEQNWEIGDCKDLLNNIDDNSVDLLFTDPPYGMGYHSGWYVEKNPHNKIINDSVFDEVFNRDWLSTASDKMKETSCMMCFTGYQVLNEWQSLISERWNIKNIIIWVKNNWTAGDLTCNAW